MCKVIDCDKPTKTKGYCNMHYLKFWKYGDAFAGRTVNRGQSWNTNGYRRITHNGKERLEHHVIAEKVLGKALPKTVVIHHVNNVHDDNKNENLVICPNQDYHMLLHRRTKAHDECGNANYRWCFICRKWDDPINMVIHGKYSMLHRRCRALRRREYTTGIRIPKSRKDHVITTRIK